MGPPGPKFEAEALHPDPGIGSARLLRFFFFQKARPVLNFRLGLAAGPESCISNLRLHYTPIAIVNEQCTEIIKEKRYVGMHIA